MRDRHTIRNISLSISVLIMTILPNALSIKHSHIVFVNEPSNVTFTFVENKTDKRFTINTEGCIIPNVNPNDNSIRRFLDWTATKLAPSCPNQEHRLLIDNRTHIMIVKENLKFYKIADPSRLNCCYKSFYRPRQTLGIPNKIVDNRIKYSDCILFHDEIKVDNEFVQVQCNYSYREIYNQFFIFAPKKAFTSYRTNPFSNERSMFNIIIMGVGSISRQNFYRTMPKTWNMLKNYESVELKGYSTVAADTFQNLIPVLAGMNIAELRSTCWPKPQDTLDSCPYIWERFKDIGYYTALAEDTAKYGVFNMGKVGFRGSPTDYYIYPFIHQSETITAPAQKKSKKRFRKKSKSETVQVCMGDRYYFEVLLNYIESLTTTVRTERLFGLFWESSMSRNNLSSPRAMDDAYVRLFKHLDVSGYLENTMLVFLSDHGMSHGGVHSTKQGLIEQRQPLAYIFTPESFRIEFKLAYHNLQHNQERLTTPFDIHRTLIDLLDLSDITDSEISQRSKEFYSNERGISLFLPISNNRTCKMADIDKEWCNCYDNVKLTLNNFTKIGGVKQFLSKHLNEPLNTYSQCAELSVVDVIEAYEMVPGYQQNMEWRDYKFIISVAPGGGIFEAILRYYKNSKNWVLVNAIKRLNVNSSSDCVEDDYVKLYCYCKKSSKHE